MPFITNRHTVKTEGMNEIVSLFLSREGGFISGEALGKPLGITRAALWKKITFLREKGFVIEAVRGKGYRLLKTPDLSIEELKAALHGGLSKEVFFFDSIGSTNDYAMELASDGFPHGTIVIADAQTKGRGRLGRKWHSPPGKNIYMSVILRPEIPPRDAGLITLLSAVAAASAIKKITGLDAGIKWPNDIMVGEKKLGGILLDMRSEQDRIIYAVIGMGINVNLRAGEFPHEIGLTATSVLMETGKPLRRTDLVRAILESLGKEYRMLKREGREGLLKRWRGLSSTLGRDVEVIAAIETVKGNAIDIDNEGCLLVRTKNGILKRISSGDIRMLR